MFYIKRLFAEAAGQKFTQLCEDIIQLSRTKNLDSSAIHEEFDERASTPEFLMSHFKAVSLEIVRDMYLKFPELLETFKDLAKYKCLNESTTQYINSLEIPVPVEVMKGAKRHAEDEFDKENHPAKHPNIESEDSDSVGKMPVDVEHMGSGIIYEDHA